MTLALGHTGPTVPQQLKNHLIPTVAARSLVIRDAQKVNKQKGSGAKDLQVSRPCLFEVSVSLVKTLSLD